MIPLKKHNFFRIISPRITSIFQFSSKSNRTNLKQYSEFKTKKEKYIPSPTFRSSMTEFHKKETHERGKKKVASFRGANFPSSPPENSERKSIEGWQNGEESRKGEREIGCGKGGGLARGDYDARRQPSWRGRFSLSRAEPAGDEEDGGESRNISW